MGAKTFQELPIVRMPADYDLKMPDFIAEMAEQHGPIFRRDSNYGWGDQLAMMVGPEANKFVMQSHRDHFSHEQGWTPVIGGMMEKGLINTDDPEHARQRKMMNPAFTIAYMSKYIPIMSRIIEERVQDWAERGTVDLYKETRKITFDVAAEALVGFHTGGEVDRLRELFYTLMGFEAETQEEYFRVAMAARQELDDRLIKRIAERRANPTDDILGLLVQARDEDDQPFSDRELLGQIHILLIAGHETSTTLSAFLLYELATRPEWMAKVRQELDEVLASTGGEVTLEAIKAMKIMGQVLDETGRLHSPVSVVPRGVVKEFEFGGYTVPVGTRVLLALSATHRMPSVFANPQAFDPDRFAPPREEDKRTPYALAPFGGGPRICIGINFATVEVKALAALVLQKYDLQPVEGHDIVTYHDITALVASGIPVKVRMRDER